MIRRPASLILVSVLVMIQLLVGAFAQAAPLEFSDAGCVGDWPAQPAPGTGFHSADHSQVPAGIHDDSNGTGQQHAGTHVVCRCGCAHTPAMGADRLVILTPTPPAEIIGALAASAFDAPLFDFLRPPN